MRAIRVQFKPVGKRYFFGLGNFELHDGMDVVVSTIRGLELGWCVGEPFELDNRELTSELKDVIRIATENDKEKFKKNKPDIIIKKAKERLGEKGYNIISNNCLHFVNECVFNKHYSEQTKRAI